MNYKIRVKDNIAKVQCDKLCKINPRELELLKKREIPELFVPDLCSDKKKIAFSYDTTGYIPLGKYILRGIKKREFIEIVKSCINLHNIFKEKLLQNENCLFDLKYIYIQPGSRKIKYIYVPVLYSNVKDYTVDYLRALPFYCIFSSADPHEYVRSYIDFFNNLISFSMYNFVTMIEKLEIEKNDDKDLYAYIVSEATNKKYIFASETYTIGKSQMSDIVVDSEHVSRNHAKLIYYNENYYIQDCNSSNYTFINGKKIPSGVNVVLNNGDMLRFADMSYVFYRSSGRL